MPLSHGADAPEPAERFMKAAFMPRSRGFVGRLSAVAQTLRALRPERRGGCAEAPGPAGSEGSLRDRSGAACGAAARELPAELGDASRKLLSSPALISKRAVLTSNVIFFFPFNNLLPKSDQCPALPFSVPCTSKRRISRCTLDAERWVCRPLLSRTSP